MGHHPLNWNRRRGIHSPEGVVQGAKFAGYGNGREAESLLKGELMPGRYLPCGLSAALLAFPMPPQAFCAQTSMGP